MSDSFPELGLNYGRLLRRATANHVRVEQLPALESAICGPRERLWLIGNEVRRLRLKGKGKRARWTLDTKHALRSAEWMTRKLSRTVLIRLFLPDNSPGYAFDPNEVERDLVVLAELDKVWLAGARDAPYGLAGERHARSLWYVRSRETRDPVVVDALICDRIARAEAELRWAMAVRAQNLVENYGTPGDVAAALDCNLDEAELLMSAHERFLAGLRAGAARSREVIPVHRPSGAAGMPASRAARLMTAACDSETVVPGRPYPHPLPPELAPWHVYTEAGGHCIAVAVKGFYRRNRNPCKYMALAPVGMVLHYGWTIRDGVVVARLAASTFGGQVTPEWDQSYEEY